MSDFTLPHQLFRAEQVRQLDALAIEVGAIPSIQLMKRAGRAVFNRILQHWPNTNKLVVCCGRGNNGGDGYVIAALAAQNNIAVEVLSVCAVQELTADARKAYEFAVQEGVAVQEVDDWSKALTEAEGVVLVDALLGTGLQGEVRPPMQAAIKAINASGALVVAADTPSGLCSDSGCVLGAAVKADLTVSFIGLKRGLLTGSGPAYSGQLAFDSLGLEQGEKANDVAAAFTAVKAECKRIGTPTAKAALAPRAVDAHKGLLGHVMVIGGDTGYGGAVALAAEACARSGAGLTSVATQPYHVPPILARVPEAMVTGVASGQALEPLMSRPSVIVIGPGLGRTPWSEQMLQQAVATDVPLIIDADGLNILAEGRVVPNAQRGNWILTPHPGEAARLLNTTVEAVQADRFAAVAQLQQRYGGVVVLKGVGTLISDGRSLLLADVGNPGMASGGMGDVLSGVIGALVGQGLSAIEAAALAVCVHGDAADLAVAESGERGLLASDLIPYIRELLNS